MGDRDDFGIDTVVEDVKKTLSLHELLQRKSGGGTKRVILVGHSMGAKIATYYATKYPEDVAALVLEDMDIRRRPVTANPIPLDMDVVRFFNRRFATLDDAVEKLTRAGYPSDRIEKWVREGRVRKIQQIVGQGDEEEEEEEGCWSDVNPEFRALSYERFCDNESATTALKDIACWLKGADAPFPCHLLIADDEMTICDNESVEEMCQIMGSMLRVQRFEGAAHSIHNSKQEQFLELLEDIVSNASANK